MNIRKILICLLFVGSVDLLAKNLVPESYWDIQSVSSPLVSPDGQNVIYAKKYIDKKNDTYITELWIMDADGSNKRSLLDGSNPQWSPDGLKIAFIKDDENEISQIHVKHLQDQSESKITNFGDGIEDYAWSKNGEYFSFSAFNEYDDKWIIEIPGKEEGQEYNWTEDPTVVTSMHWRSDGIGEQEIGENHLYVVESSGGSAIKISDWGLDYVDDLQWLNDSQLLFTGNDSLNDLETPWKQSSVFLLNVKNKKLEKISNPKGVFSTPKASADGTKIVFTGHPSKEYSSVANDVYVRDVARKKNKLLTNNLSASPKNLFWISSNEIVFDFDHRGSAKVMTLNLENSKLIEVIPEFKDQFFLSSAYQDALYGIYVTPDRPAEVALIANAKLENLTQHNELLLGQYELGATNEINYKSPDDMEIQGWYITPPNFDESKKYPLILAIHGGPHAMYRPAFRYSWQQFASDGYVVLFTNPRGSTGYGSEFANVIDNDYPGSGDLSDLLSGVDYLAAKGFIDESKMYVQGCSGGGVLTAWVVGHDDRFAAAASLCPVTNWISMVGTTDIPAWTFEWFDKPFWEDPSNWLDRSPIMRTGYIKTPTLFMTGVLDIRTPMPQTEEMYVALKEAGVETVLIRMNKEWHGTSSKPSNWFRTYGYLTGWYEKFQK
jgi:dipeptidyl aminopeptidase/acylaminoacyl peptidase